MDDAGLTKASKSDNEPKWIKFLIEFSVCAKNMMNSVRKLKDMTFSSWIDKNIKSREILFLNNINLLFYNLYLHIYEEMFNLFNFLTLKWILLKLDAVVEHD